MTGTAASAGPEITLVPPGRRPRPGAALPGRCASTAGVAAIGWAMRSSASSPGPTPARARTNPVIPVVQGRQRWLVAPYGAVPWVLNARAAGRVRLCRGRDRHDYTIQQLPPAEAGPVLQRYVRVASAARPYFQANKDSPVADFIAEADRHPVFELTPISEGRC